MHRLMTVSYTHLTVDLDFTVVVIDFALCVCCGFFKCLLCIGFCLPGICKLQDEEYGGRHEYEHSLSLIHI